MSPCTNGTKWICVITINVLLWAIAFGFVHHTNRPNNKVGRLSEKALFTLVDNPSTINILDITRPERVYGKSLLSEQEADDIAVSMSKLNETVMKRTANFTNFDDSDTEISELMARQMSTISTLQPLMSKIGNDNKENSDFSGWKQKIEFTAVSKSGISYRSQYWFFFDKDGDILTKSFEIPCFD